MSNGKNFVDFITDAQDDKERVKEFAKLQTAQEMKAFFQQGGYTGISDADIEKILQLKDRIGARLVGQGDCDYY